ncbi:MAG: alpha/beta fold hydrolase [Janthinobacterium lividum]
MPPELKHATAHVNGIKMHYVEAGEGPPVILLHGFPETWFAWRHQIPFLAEHYRVIAPDLRGYGSTDKPPTGYDKRNMAKDIRDLMQSLGIERCPIIGHDRGARVGLRFAKDYPEATARFAALDNIPTRTIFTRMDANIAKLHWFFIFNNVRDLPEALITDREEIWLRYIFSTWCFNPELFTDDEIREYVKAYRQPGALKGAFDDYRAGPEDVAQDEADKEVKVACPVLVLWGEDFIAGGKLWDFREIWHEYATNPQYVSIPQCGHLPHEEKPAIVNEALLRFLRG